MKNEKLKDFKNMLIKRLENRTKILNEKTSELNELKKDNEYIKGYLTCQINTLKSDLDTIKNDIEIIKLLEKQNQIQVREMNGNLRILDCKEFKIEVL
ncbi:hypothetical protein [Sulfurimonas sp.]|uniref:hypothetical protein n=1 Tax=Sulfurimonas sp. TaxID=2022749 RepID=UPI001A0CC269|nr:hypothetical protein [Sulfurimonas sp.]MBE0514222.1 hypothetical protein [Sulfurimonas sp.]